MKPMLATQYNEAGVTYPCLVQPKYDGVRCLCLIGEDGEVHFLSRNGKEYNVPHLKRWAEEHQDMLPFDGEIYSHDELTFQQICSAVKCQSELTDKLKFIIYDKPTEGKPFHERWARLLIMSRNIEPPFVLSRGEICNCKEEIEKFHDEFVGEGYEGAIIRNLRGTYIQGRSGDLMKYKKFDTTEFVIIDVVEALGKDKGTAIFKLKGNGGEFCARPIGSQELRAKYYAEKCNIIGKLCTIQHQGYSDSGIPRFPVALTIRDYE